MIRILMVISMFNSFVYFLNCIYMYMYVHVAVYDIQWSYFIQSSWFFLKYRLHGSIIMKCICLNKQAYCTIFMGPFIHIIHKPHTAVLHCCSFVFSIKPAVYLVPLIWPNCICTCMYSGHERIMTVVCIKIKQINWNVYYRHVC